MYGFFAMAYFRVSPRSFKPEQAVDAWPLGLGLLLLAMLWLGPLPEMSRRAFSPHMILHLGVVTVVAPLLAVGLLRIGFVPRAIGRPLLLTFSAAAFEVLVVWGWHAPVMHEAAARYDLAFVAQQLTFLAAGMAIWLASFSGTSRAAHGLGALAMLFTSTHMAMLGILLALAPDLLYSPLFCLGAFGLGPLNDQHLGGVLMAVAGSLPYLFGGLVLAHRMLQD